MKSKTDESYIGPSLSRAMTVGIVRETLPGESRVALVPAVVPVLARAGLETVVEIGAGSGAYASDEAYQEKGARLVSRNEAYASDVVARVQPPSDAEIALLRPGAVLLGFLKPLEQPGIAAALAERGITALAMELVPRISRAQRMDALSAMASLSGYKAAVLAASQLPSFFPLLTTAAGTVRPATVTVLGAGVAGLQAIATARRLGARVWGYDIREAVREEIRSLGAQFVELDLDIGDQQDEAGYARALMEEKARRQTELLVPQIAASSVVISAALIPGRRAPTLVTARAVEAMRAGSVVVDLAAASGGNCELTVPDTVVEHGGVRIMGPTNLPATMPVDASHLLARTMAAMIEEFTQDGNFVPNVNDEIFAGALVSHEGAVANERVQLLLAA